MGRGYDTHAPGEWKLEQVWDSRAAAYKPEEEMVGYALCHDRLWDRTRITTEAFDITCSKCSAKFAAQRIKAQDLNIRLERMPTGSGYRSVLKVWYNEALVAYVVFESGWGGAWTIHGLALDGQGEVIMNRAGLDPNTEQMAGMRAQKLPGSFHSKEAAMLAVPQFLALGVLKTAAQVREEADSKREFYRLKSAERSARRRAKLDKDTEVYEGLKSIYDRRQELGLTNFELAALQYAVEHVDTPEEGDDE